MKIGIIVEGAEETTTFGMITSKIEIADCQLLKPIYAPIQPKATALQIAKSLESRIKILMSKKVDKIIVTVDLEDLEECPGVRAKELESAIVKKGYENVKVVIKKRKFENWIIADIENLKKQKLFDISKSLESRIENKADSILDAVKELSNVKKGKKSYEKGRDGTAIAKTIDPLNIAKNSRSFRKFLKSAGHPSFQD